MKTSDSVNRQDAPLNREQRRIQEQIKRKQEKIKNRIGKQTDFMNTVLGFDIKEPDGTLVPCKLSVQDLVNEYVNAQRIFRATDIFTKSMGQAFLKADPTNAFWKGVDPKFIDILSKLPDLPQRDFADAKGNEEKKSDNVIPFPAPEPEDKNKFGNEETF